MFAHAAKLTKMANLTKLVRININFVPGEYMRKMFCQSVTQVARLWMEPPLWSSGYQSRCTTTKLRTFQHPTMSRCPKEMRKIYAASWILFTLTAEADRVLCQLVMSLTVFSTGCKKWNSAAIKSLLLFRAGLFTGYLVEKYVTCHSRKSDFGWHCFRFSPWLMRKEGWKVWSDSGLTWYLSGAASRKVSLSNYRMIIDVCFYI